MKAVILLVGALGALGGGFARPASVEVNGSSGGAINARMLRFPDVSATQIVFVYAGDIWLAPKEGGYAQRLSSPKGEESLPRFSPDGSRIAFSGNYDGNIDIYVAPAYGGLPRRITYHGEPDRMLDWYPDGETILFASMRTSEKERFNHLYRVSAKDGLPVKLPLPYGEFGMIAPDGKTLAYIPLHIDFTTWKRYRGGMNPDIWLFNLENFEAKNVTQNDAADSEPMWHGSTLYFLSDRDKNKRANIWAYDTKKDKVRQVTFFEQSDIRFPSIGPNDIVFENGGRLYLLDLATEKHREVEIKVVTDRATLKPRLDNVSELLRRPDVSPSGKRAVFEARGEIFTVPAEHGPVRNLTRSSGVAERNPAWSPDGKMIAYFSDRSGEYELTLRPADGLEETTLTQLGPGYRYRPVWSPDSKKIAFIDQTMRIHLHDLDKKETKQIDKLLWALHGRLSDFKFSWSRDSRWLAYAKDQDHVQSAIMLYDTTEGKGRQVTSGFYNDDEPVFDRDGKYLFFLTGRTLKPVYCDLDETWIYPNTMNLAAVSLRKDVPSPLAPRNDEEGEKDKKKDKSDSEDKDSDKDRQEKDKDKKDGKDDENDKKKDKPPKPVEIDLDDFERRLVILPPKAGRYGDLASVSGKLIYRRLARAGAHEDEKPDLMYYDFEKREEKTILDDVDEAILADKGEKLLVRHKDDYAIIDVKEDQKMGKKLRVSELETLIDPVAEWKQLFTEAWRLQRDYFYDPGMHGVDWNAMRKRYAALLEDAVTRWDVNYVIGELIGELNASHAYRGGGDTEKSEERGVGYLGVDFALENGAYRIKKIIEGAVWDAEVRSPLRQPGVDIKEGDYLLAVNGLPVDTSVEPWAAFQGLADKPVLLTVNDKPTLEGARDVLVRTLARESRLRHLAWIEANRRKVEEASQGEIGYVFVPDTGHHGQSELVRQFRAQVTKPGLIIDERFNNGGQWPDRFVELLGRSRSYYMGTRDGRDVPWPYVAHNGPKAMLINAWAGSGGDAFPHNFQQAKLGPLIGTRTYGGLIGISGAPSLIDGGMVTVPTMGWYSTKGEWLIEGHGVDPDITVIDDPSKMARGGDPQLERAIEEVLKALKKQPPVEVGKPKYPLRAGS